MPKFSIILPVRNGGYYIKECVNSILVQQYTDFNLDILDNDSNDGTSEWINSLGDKRINIYPSKSALSIEENWKRALTVRKNEYMTLIGHDDILYPHYLTVMNKLISDNPSAGLYHSHFRYIDGNGKLVRKCKQMPAIMSSGEFLSSFLKNELDSMGTGFMMRSADYEAVGGIPTAYSNLLFADFELWINIVRGKKIAVAKEEAFAFRLHQSTTTTSPDIKFQKSFKTFLDYLTVLSSKDQDLREVIQRDSVQFIDFYCRSLSHRLLRAKKSDREGLTVSGLIEECKKYARQLAPGKTYKPEKKISILAARLIDKFSVSRWLFLLFKKLYRKPVMK